MKVIYKSIEYKEAIDFLLPLHYSGRKPQIKYAFGAYINDILMACVTYGVPASRSLCIGILGEKYSDKVLELNRLCRVENYTHPLSQLVAYSLQKLKHMNLCIVSYSDLSMQHHGSIYQACNFLYIGTTKERTDKYTEKGKHSRHYTNDNNHLRKVRSAKHRYIYLACDKRFKKIFLKELKYPIINIFPKGDKVNYILGEYQKSLIINTQTGEKYYE